MKTFHCVSVCLAAAFIGSSQAAGQGAFATGLSNAGLNAFRDAVLPMVNKELAAFSVSALSLAPLPCRELRFPSAPMHLAHPGDLKARRPQEHPGGALRRKSCTRHA